MSDSTDNMNNASNSVMGFFNTIGNQMMGKSDARVTGAQGINYGDYADAINRSKMAATGDMGAKNAQLAGQQQVAARQVGQIGQQQQSLANALLAQSQGQGPNPAQEQFKQNLNTATQNAAGTISSAKGINPALAARIVAGQQGAANQNAASGAAQLQAQQQLAAQQALMQQQQAMVGTAGVQNGIYGGIAGQNIAQQNANTNTLGTAGQLQNQANAQNIQNQQWTQGTNLGVQLGNDKAASAMMSQTVNGLWGTAGSLAGGVGKMAGAMAHGGVVKTNDTGWGTKAYKDGGEVPGRAAVEGDSPANDTVPTMLSPGEIVIPRSKAKDPDKAKEFVEALKASQKADEPKGYGKVLMHLREIAKRQAEIQKLLGKG